MRHELEAICRYSRRLREALAASKSRKSPKTAAWPKGTRHAPSTHHPGRSPLARMRRPVPLAITPTLTKETQLKVVSFTPLLPGASEDQ